MVCPGSPSQRCLKAYPADPLPPAVRTDKQPIITGSCQVFTSNALVSPPLYDHHHNACLQGQEGPAEAVLDKYTKEGGWVFLDNVHLMQVRPAHNGVLCCCAGSALSCAGRICCCWLSSALQLDWLCCRAGFPTLSASWRSLQRQRMPTSGVSSQQSQSTAHPR